MARRRDPYPPLLAGPTGLILTMALWVAPASGQSAQPGDTPGPPIAGTWETVESLGQPPRFKTFGRLGYGLDRSGEGEEAGPMAALGVYRDLFNPVYGALGLTFQGYAGQRGDQFDGGLQLHVESPATFLHAGVDWNARLNRFDATLGTTIPVRRGGWPTTGAQVRVDWIPGRAQSLVLGVSVPLRQPLQGRTRSRTVDVALPSPPDVSERPPTPLDPALASTLAELTESIDWMAGLHGFFWLTNFSSLDHEKTIVETREALLDFRERLDARASLMPDRSTYEREVEHYHDTLDRAFALALDGLEPREAPRARAVADRLRRLTLEEVVLPYNRTIGRYKQPDRLDGLAARARARFAAWLEVGADLNERQVRRAVATADAWLDELEVLRDRMSELKGDSRMQWLPLALVLRPEEHDTQEEIDAILSLALGRPFEAGNEVDAIDALAFQEELRRSIRETESYHVLWVHDYRGRNVLGDPDRIGFQQTTQGYLRALIDRVRNYDATGALPVYILMIDQFFYEANGARLWLDLLERPLEHDFRISGVPHDFVGALQMEAEVRALQDSLRNAVASSRRMQADREAFGSDWMRDVVKVHVNVTHPSDFTFRSRRLLRRPPIGADNLMRDHRKIVIRDVTEADPARGEVIFAGVGVGEHYASPTWDDRALVLRGPAAVEAKDRARDVLERHGLTGTRLPPPLRPLAPSRDYLRRIQAMEASGATARVMQVHNRTGWGEKDASFLQMLVYDLVPAGTVIYVPDSMWTSYEWMAQLVSAALRGCLVYVVAPSLANAPSVEFPIMSTMQELITRLVLVADVFDDVIEAAGGELQVGLYTRQAPLDDLPELLTDVDTTFQANPFLQELFPFSEEARDVMRRLASPSEEPEARPRSAGDLLDRLPKMHRKTQLVASVSVLRALSASSDLPAFLEASLGGMGGRMRDASALEAPRRLVEAHERYVQDGVVQDPVLYFLTGSVNKNVRSMALDGEVLAAVAGPWALHAYLDFVLLSGGVTWVRGVEDVDRLLPPYSSLKRLLSRWLHRVL